MSKRRDTPPALASGSSAKPAASSQLGASCKLSAEAIAQEIVDAALSVEFRPDPIFRSPLSRAFSLMQSVVTRHGAAIQTMLADGLSQDDRFEVFKDHPVPITVAAMELAASRTSSDNFKWATLSASGTVHHVAIVDMFTIQLERGWAGVFDSKRGQAATPGSRRRTIELDLQAMRLTLPSFARQMGFLQVDYATSAVIDYFGNAGFRESITVPHHSIDRLFETELTPKIDAMTAALEARLHIAVCQVLKHPVEGRQTRGDAEKAGAEIIRLFRGRTSQEPSRDASAKFDEPRPPAKSSVGSSAEASAPQGADASPFGRWWPKPNSFDAALRKDIERLLAAVHFPNEPYWPAAARGDASSAINLAIRAHMVQEPDLVRYKDVILVALWRCVAQGDPTAQLVFDWLRNHPATRARGGADRT